MTAIRVLGMVFTLVASIVVWPSLAVGQSVHSTIQRVQQRTVKVFGAGGIKRLHSYSTGFVVSSAGHVATVWSHVLDTEELTVVLADGRKIRAKVLGAEPQLDLAVLELDAEALELPAWDLEAESSDAGPGTRVLGFSNMFRVATGDEMVSVLHGVVAAKAPLATRSGAFETSYEGTAYIVDAVTNNPGAGGGVLTTRGGQLLGMIGKELRNAASNTWVNYAVPISELKQPIQQIIAGKYRARQRGADDKDAVPRFRPLEFGIVLVPDVLFRTPAFIDRVQPGSVAATAGLQPDDLVLFVNGDLVQSCRVLKRRLGRLDAGGTLKLTVRRGDKLVPVELPVPDKPLTPAPGQPKTKPSAGSK
ncbi:MAG TPA: serine protease [Planctomycetaceae bacterium]|nr:serine protease [Planctomycetaceae bacterium]|tara:strand:- start:10089 stop:11174 length:1086 start_codon:yes stop_codon:yes gene_type:complete